MTLQSSGPISASEIQTEFGGASPFRLSDYYAGGPNVPAGTVGDGGPIPASGTIKFSDFYGSTKFITVVKTITVGDQGGNRGFVTGSIGSMAPDEILNGVNIRSIFAPTSPDVVRISLIANLPQSFWHDCVIQNGPTLVAAAATTFTPGSDTVWDFANVFNFPDATHTVTFRYVP